MRNFLECSASSKSGRNGSNFGQSLQRRLLNQAALWPNGQRATNIPNTARAAHEAGNLDLPESFYNQATTLLRAGKIDEAEVLYRQVLELAPDHVEARFHLACVLTEKGKYREALAAIEAILILNPKLEKACFIGSVIEYKAGRYPEALAWIERAITLAPSQIKLLMRRAEILARLGSHDPALADCNSVLDWFPDDLEAIRVKASILQDLNRPQDALAMLVGAQSQSPHTATLTVDSAWLLAELGRKDEALQLLDQTISAAPDFAPALECRSFLSRHTPDHPDVRAMKDIVGNAKAPTQDRMRLSFALGRTYLDAGDGENAFHHLNLGNGLKRKTIPYHGATEEKWFSSIVQTFSANRLRRSANGGICSARPIFVFGMPRSGTTLVEQILASHSLVCGTGETPHLDRLARASLCGAPEMTTENLAMLGDQYLRLLGSAIPDGQRFVDKTNSNFLHAGLISLMLPGARMIHCRRDPLDTCLSSYSLLFTHGNEFSYDLAELGEYYNLYRKLMSHWRDALSAGTMLDLEYEKLVSDPDAQIRQMLEFCGLPWEEDCLRFYETKRMVKTSSVCQVRSPIYKSSVGRAQMFRPWLDDLIQAMNDSTMSAPDES